MQTKDNAVNYRQQNRTTLQLALWTLAWLLSLAAARFGPELLWGTHPVPNWIAVGVNVVIGIAWIISFARFLRAQDELWRKISLDAVGITLGVGWVVGFGYVVAEAAGLISFDLNLALFPALLGVVYILAVGIGWIRYR